MKSFFKILLIIVGLLFIITGLMTAGSAFTTSDPVVVLGRLVAPIVSFIIGVLLIRFGIKIS
jgi:hypothetical protein